MGLLDTIYAEAKKERGPLGLRVGDFVPYVSGLLAADDARLAAQQGNYGEAAGALAGLVPGGRLVKKLTGVDLNPVSPRQIFAGPKAKGADLNAMQRAEQRLAAGDDPRKVWAEEGWFRGPDGKMRWEISDRQASFDPRDAASEAFGRGPKEGDVFGLLDVYSNKPLTNAYPEVSDVTVGFLPNERMGRAYAAYSDKYKRLTLPETARHSNEKSAATHELQHFVQNVEGFPSGGNPKGMRDEAIALLKQDLASGQIPSKEEAVKMFPEYKRKAYWQLLGEVEARATQKRLNLTNKQRREIYPTDSYDTPVDQIIIKNLID